MTPRTLHTFPGDVQPLDRNLSRPARILFFLLSAVMFAAAVTAYVWLFEVSTGLKYTYTVLLICFIVYIFSKYFFASLYQPLAPWDGASAALDDATVALLIPVFNEGEAVMRVQVASILAQRKPFSQVFFIDDGSTKDRSGVEYLRTVAAQEPLITLVEMEHNVGKRHAQAAVLPLVTSDFIMTTDSDTVMERDCLFNLLLPLYAPDGSGEGISAVTGKVLAYNSDTNLLTSVLNLRYYNAFDVERASQSVTGSVIVASGPVTIYRSEIILENLDEYVNQTFLGRPQTLGDDRCLTNIALRTGKVVYQATALVLTEIPDTLRAFRLQQTRWSRSWFRESILGVPNAIRVRKPIIIMWLVIELVMFFAIFASIALTIYWMFVPGYLTYELLGFFGFIVWNAWVRNIYYSAVSFREFLKAPIYGYLHMFVVLPVKVYALFTMRNNSWVTRSN